MAELPARPRAHEQVVVRLMLSMPPATTSLASPANRLIGQHDGLKTGAAHFVDRQCRNARRQPRSLKAAWRAAACPKPAESTLPMMTSSMAAGSTPAAHRFGNSDRAQLRRLQAGQAAQEFADWRATAGEYVACGHVLKSMLCGGDSEIVELYASESHHNHW